jgi:hypothetical protein
MSESSSDRFRQRSDYVRSPITDLVQSTVAERPRKHFSACKRCHARKIKCSGDRPCTGCQATDHPQSSCVYPARDRKIKISQSYIQRLVEENNDLRQSVLSTHGSPTAITSPRQPDLPEETYDQDANVRKALIDDRAWFVPYSTASAPVYIEEASCTAFATRFRQSLDPSTGSHRLRASYVKDADLVSTADLNAPWPARTQARLLVKVALAHIGQSYHLTLAKATLNRLDRVYEDSNFNDPTSACKFFGLFALGEVYSNTAPSHSNDRAHGLMFFRKASSLVQVFPERPTIDHIENFILLVCVSILLHMHLTNPNVRHCFLAP